MDLFATTAAVSQEDGDPPNRQQSVAQHNKKNRPLNTRFNNVRVTGSPSLAIGQGFYGSANNRGHTDTEPDDFAHGEDRFL